MPYCTHALSRTQRWLIVVTSTVALAVASVGIYAYEHYYRGPANGVLVGTWRLEDGCIDCTPLDR